MRTFARLALAAAVLVPGAPAGAVHAGPGVLCGFASTSLPGNPLYVQVGVLVGGPLTMTTGGTLECSVQVGSDQPAAPDVVAAVATGGDVLVLEPTPFVYDHRFEPVYTCTAYVDAAGVRWYWDGIDWSVRDTSPCQEASYVKDEPNDTYESIRPALCTFFLDLCAPPLFASSRVVGIPRISLRVP